MKRIIALITAAVLLLSLCGCGEGELKKTSKKQLTLAGEPSELGYIYYSDGNSVRRVKQNGTGDKAFTDFFSKYLFFYDGWVYYVDRENHPECPATYLTAPIIHRRREDGSGDQCVCSRPASKVTLHDGYIYYTPYYGSSKYNYGDGLYRINPDGSDEVLLYPNGIAQYDFDGGYIYIEIAGNDILRMNPDGSGLREIIDGREYSGVGIADLAFDNDYIYFTADLRGEHLDNLFLFRIKKDGSEKTQLTDMSTKDFLLMGDNIYFVGSKTTISDRHLYKMNCDGGNPKRVCSKRVSSDRDYLQTDGTYIYVSLVNKIKYDRMAGEYESIGLYRFKG